MDNEEVYGLPVTECPKCGVDYKPGIMYDIKYSGNACSGMGASGLTDVPIKCMKCPSCGDSRSMTTEEERQYAGWYKRIEP